MLPEAEDVSDRPPHARTLTLQQWEGTVEEVAEEAFTARLVDRTADHPDEVATFPLDEVVSHDRPLVAPGAVFYWWVGYRDSVGGRARQSLIRFRRLPALSGPERERIVSDARRLATAFDHPDP